MEIASDDAVAKHDQLVKSGADLAQIRTTKSLLAEAISETVSLLQRH